MANRAQSTNLPHIEGEFADAARQNLSPATMNMPVTAQQADTIIQQSLTKPVAGEFSKRPGGKAYSETRGAARNAAAQEFYKKIAPGGEAAKAAQSAANDLKVLEDFNKNFGAGDLVGDPKLSAPGRYLSAGSGVAPNSATLLRKLKRFDEVSTRNGQPSNLAGDAVQLAQKIEWGAHDQRVIARIATIMGTGSLKDVGAWRDAIRGLARLSVRSQGRVGAAGRAGTVATFNQPDRKKQEATFESAMRSQLYP